MKMLPRFFQNLLRYPHTPIMMFVDGENLTIRYGNILKSRGIESPHVFKRTKSRGSKRVDISLSTAMLLNACRKNYDVVILIAGDEDYLPLVEAVKAEGRIVLLWFFED